MKGTWEGWLIFVEGNLCVATKNGQRLTTPMPAMATPQHSFYRASERIKDDIRKSARSTH